MVVTWWLLGPEPAEEPRMECCSDAGLTCLGLEDGLEVC